MRGRRYRTRRRYSRRRAPQYRAVVLMICVGVILILGAASVVPRIREWALSSKTLVANAQAAGFQQLPEGQALLRRTMRPTMEAEDVTERLLELLRNELEGSVSAEGIAILDEEGQLLYGYNEDVERSPASMTKLMTAIVMLDEGCLEDTVTVGDLYSCYVDGSVLLYLEEGEEIAMRDLLAALMIMSANDAAAAIAIHVGGSIEEFAQMMNDKAQEMGLEHTHFVNPHGLTADGHYTTPHDMALIVQRASRYDILREMTTKLYQDFSSIGPSGEEKTYWVDSGNGFVLGYNDVEPFRYICGKTGYTGAAGLCLAAAFENEETGKEYYCVVMKSQSHFADMTQTVQYLGERLDVE